MFMDRNCVLAESVLLLNQPVLSLSKFKIVGKV